MDVVAVAIWFLVAALALPVAGGALSGAAGLGAQPIAAMGGLALCILFFVIDGAPDWAAWGAFGLACVGIVADVHGANSLLSSERPVSADLQAAEELEAGLLGVQLPLFGVAALLSFGMAVGGANLAT